MRSQTSKIALMSWNKDENAESLMIRTDCNFNIDLSDNYGVFKKETACPDDLICMYFKSCSVFYFALLLEVSA